MADYDRISEEMGQRLADAAAEHAAAARGQSLGRQDYPVPVPQGGGGGGNRYGKLDADWKDTDDPPTATVSIWAGGADTNEDVTVDMVPWIETWDLSAGTWIKLEYYADDDAWLATPQIAQAVVTDQRIDTATKKLQVKTRPAVGAFTGPETDWADKYTFTAVTPLTSFQVDGANKKLQDKTTQFYAIEPGTESGWTDIHTGEVGVCP